MPRRTSWLFPTLLAALAAAACVHKPPGPAAASPPGAASTAPAPALDPDQPDDIIALGKRLAANRLALYSVAQGKYRFFVGGILDAEYETATAILRISSLQSDTAGPACVYSSQGVLFVDPKTAPDRDAYAAGCDRLARRLDDYLSR